MSDQSTKSLTKAEQRVLNWLAKHRSSYADPAILSALARCPTAQALELAAAVLSVRGWRQAGPSVFVNHAYQLEIGADCAGQQVQLLFSSRKRKEVVAFEVYSETPEENLKNSNDQRAAQIRREARYIRLSVGHMTQALRWLRDSLKKDLSHRIESELPSPLVGRATTRDLDWSRVPPPVRQMRLPAWLEVHREAVDEHLLPILAQCETTAEMRFLLVILKGLEWRILNRNRLQTHNMELRIQWPIDGGHFDFVIAHRSSMIFKPTVIEIVRPNWLGRNQILKQRIEDEAHRLRFSIMFVDSVDASSKARWWVQLIKDAAREPLTVAEGALVRLEAKSAS